MVHLGRTGATLMLDMAAAAVLNARMKSGGLLAKVEGGGGMAGDAGGRVHSLGWCVTRFTLIDEKGVLRGE